MRWVVVAFVASCGFPQPADVLPPPDVSPQDNCCQLLASRPALAKAGATLILEGTFDAEREATITFPGGESAPMYVLGLHRATVVVPASATAGDLMYGSPYSYGPISHRDPKRVGAQSALGSVVAQRLFLVAFFLETSQRLIRNQSRCQTLGLSWVTSCCEE